jgi:imidazolonepropionase
MKKTLIRNIGALLTCSSKISGTPNILDSMGDLSIINNAAMLFDEEILWIGTESALPEESVYDELVDAQGRVIMPGFVDSHTHCVFAGNRSDEFARRLRGVSYQTIAAEGGGILNTVRAVRAASIDQLANQGIDLAMNAMKYGTTTIEMKSGYGLTLESELTLLKAIKIVNNEVPLRVIPTFLGAHDIPPEYRHNPDLYVDIICKDMLPAVKEEQLAVFCDVFTDTGYFTIQQSEKILNTARELGFKIKVHADELSPFGAAEMAGSLKAISADHLLYISQNGIESMMRNGCIGTLLPGTAYTLHLPYAPARHMIDSGMTIALASDCNPGSCFTENMQIILSLATTNMGMSIEEAIIASTLHGAYALNIGDECGSLEIGKSADFQMLNTRTYPELLYHFGVNHTKNVWIKGTKVV